VVVVVVVVVVIMSSVYECVCVCVESSGDDASHLVRGHRAEMIPNSVGEDAMWMQCNAVLCDAVWLRKLCIRGSMLVLMSENEKKKKFSLCPILLV
jgi:hypothetical protein